MKIFKNKILIAFSFILLFSGCEDLLKDESITDITTDFVYGTPEGLKSGVIALYALERKISNPGQHTGDIWLALRATNDLAVCTTGVVWNFASYNRVDPDGWGAGPIGFMWRAWYKVVDRSNTLIDAAEKIEGMDEQERLQVIAEAKVARAHAYFNLYRWFTNIFVNTVPTTPENAFTLEFKVATDAEVYAILESDLDYAIANLPWESRYGQYNQGSARHIRAKVAMWKGDWDEAAVQAEKIINDGPYELLTDLNEIFAGTKTAGNHKEAIYTRQYSDAPGGWVIHWAAAHFFPAYQNVDGMKLDAKISGKNYARIYPNDYLFSLYDKDNVDGKESDGRWEAYYYHYFFYNDGDNLPPGVQLGDTVKAFDQYGSVSEQKDFYSKIHPATIKYEDKERGIENLGSRKNIMIYRLAETYLIAAEAYMRKGDNANALNYLNAIRQRAGVPDFTGTVNQDIILEERARELALEGQRWYTLKRMGILYDRIINYASDPHYYHNEADENMKPYQVNWPIPQAELDLMPGFPQNPGY